MDLIADYVAGVDDRRVYVEAVPGAVVPWVDEPFPRAGCCTEKP